MTGNGSAVAQGRRWPVIHSVGDVLTLKGYTLGPRRIPDYELVYFPEATATVYSLDDREFTLDRPGFVLTRPGDLHSYRFDPAKHVRHLFAHFEYAPLDERDGPYASLVTGGDWLPAGDSRLPGSLMKQLLRVANEQGPRWKERSRTLLQAALGELLAEADSSFEETPLVMPAPIAQAIAYMEAHLAEPLTIREIASRTGWSHEHFSRLFAAHVGMTPRRALVERRLRRAEQLMLGGDMTVKQIAYEVGFGDEHHFSKMYKSVRGFTASDYIARCHSPLFRHTAQAVDPETPYPLNCHIVVDA